MNLDILTIIVGSTVLLLSIVASLTSLLARRPRRENATAGDTEDKGMSIVVACHDNAYELEHNLPAMLEQQYPNFEVIVVDESSTDDTDDVLKQLKPKYPNLYTTFIPESSHYLSRRKLALTVGVKAAKHEWIVFIDATCKPADDQWLACMASHCTNDKDLVMGYANYADEASAYRRFRQLFSACRNMRKAQRSTAYASGGNVIAIRRKLFMDGNGFLKDLEFLRGEYDFLVNEYAKPDRVAVVTDAVMIKDAPTHRSWVNDNLFYMETRRHLHRSKMWRLPFVVDNIFLHLAYIIDVASIIYAALTQWWIVLGAACLSLILLIVIRTIFAARTAKAMGERLPIALIPLMELRMVWTNLVLLLRHKKSDKYDFIRK